MISLFSSGKSPSFLVEEGPITFDARSEERRVGKEGAAS